MDRLNSKHLIFVILGTSIVTLKTYPNLVLRYGERNSWLAIMAASIIVFLYALYIIHICNITNCYSLYKIYTYSFGQIAGTIFLLPFIATLFLTLIESCSIQTLAMHTNMLNETPVWYIVLFFVATAVYTVKKNTKAIIIVSIIGISFIMVAGINLSIMTQKYKKIKYLFPIMANGINKNFIIAVIIALGCYSSFSVFLPYLSHIKDKNKIKKNVAIALIILIQMEVIAIIGTITSFGVQRALKIYFPKLIQTQLVSYFGFLESGELFVMLQIVGGWFIQYVLTFNSLLKILTEMKINNKYTIYILSFFIFIISSYITDNLFTALDLFNYYIYIALINFMVIPCIIFTIFYIKYKINNSDKFTRKT